MAKEKKDEIVVKQENSLVVADDFMDTYIEEHDVRDIDSSEVITPRINLLQAMSKQVKKSEAEYIKGAEEGMMMNSLTKELFSGEKGLRFVPCYNETGWNEWIPQSLGGGLAKRWGKDVSFKQTYVEEKGKYQRIATDDKGKSYVASEVSKYSDYYVLVINEDGSYFPAVIGFSGTKYKVHRKLINDISLPDYKKKDGSFVTPAPFYRVYDLFTVPESDGTNSWFNYKFERAGNYNILQNKEQVAKSAAEFRNLVQEGKIVAVAEQQDDAKVIDNDDETTI